MAFDLNAHPMLIKAIEEAKEALDEAMPLLARASNAIEPTQQEAILILLANIEATIAIPLDETLRDDISSQRSSLKRYSRALRDEETDPRELRRAMSGLSSALSEVDEDAASAGFEKTELETDYDYALEIDPAEHASELDQVRENVRASEADTIELEEEVKSSKITPEQKSEALLELERLKLKLKGLGFELDLDAIGTIRFDLAAIVRGLASFADKSARLASELIKLGINRISASAKKLKRTAATTLSVAIDVFKTAKQSVSNKTLSRVDQETREEWEVEAAAALYAGKVLNSNRAPLVTNLVLSKDFGMDTEFELMSLLEANGLNGQQLSGIDLVARYENLKDLSLNKTDVIDISAVAALHKLESLGLDDTLVEDISPLVNLDQLTALFLNRTNIRSLKPLAKLTGLTTLSIAQTNVNSLSPIDGLRNLTYLNISGTQISNLAPISNFHLLEELHISDTPIISLLPIVLLKSLHFLTAERTEIPRDQLELMEAKGVQVKFS